VSSQRLERTYYDANTNILASLQAFLVLGNAQLERVAPFLEIKSEFQNEDGMAVDFVDMKTKRFTRQYLPFTFKISWSIKFLVYPF
jgi:hypothetical protein